MRFSIRNQAVRPLLVLTLSASPLARGGLLVYEGFNYTQGAALIGATPNGSTVGLDTSAAYATTQTGAFTVVSGLSFGSLSTSGGAVRITTGIGVASARLNIGEAFSGTLWSSYLVNIAGKGLGTADGIGLRVSNSSANSSERYQSMADSRNSSTNAGALYGSGNTATNASTGLATGTTYLMLARFTNVGSTLSTTTPGVATVWALTVSQFANYLAAADGEAWLNTVAIGTEANTVTARATQTLTSFSGNDFQAGRFAQLVSVNGSVTFDEMRFGSSLAEVTPVPEPSAWAALAGLAATVFVLARRGGRSG